MNIAIRRREAALTPLFLLSPVSAAEQAAPPDVFPLHPPEMVREVVGVAHFNLKRLKELVDARPALSRAAVDWGFGDWEDALGAASHVGNREIAEYLISKGARPTLFSAAMLGQLEVVKAFVTAQPGIQRTPGPHGIPLLAHARAGGKPAAAVLEYLTVLGDAGGPPGVKLAADEAKAVTGTYGYGPKPDQQIDITEKNGVLSLQRKGTASRILTYHGERSFHPVGAREVQVRFTGAPPDLTLTIQDGETVVTARRMP